MTPEAPWNLRGECVVAWAGGGTSGPPPAGVRPLPGPSLVVAARYTASPVGAYLELTVAGPARLGPRPGFSVTTMVVDSEDAREGGRSLWGFPKEVSPLRWTAGPDGPSLRLEDRGIEVRARPRGPAFPVAVPLWFLQEREDGPVSVRAWLRGRARRADVDVQVPTGDSLGPLRDSRLGFAVSGLRLHVGPARAASR